MGTCGYKPQGTQKIMVCTRPPPVHGNYILQETSTAVPRFDSTARSRFRKLYQRRFSYLF